MKRAIFISYRRDDAEGEAGRLYDDLVRAYGDDSVFMDVAGIAPGLDFRKAIDDNVSGCGVFLAIIGPEWATIAGANGERRLEDANDFVRLEIVSALARNIAVIPVLVHEARMPHPDQLPDNIKDLAYRNSVEISHTRWNSDVQLLVNALKQYVDTTRATQTEPVHATVSVQLPPPVTPYTAPEAKQSKLPLFVGGSVAALVLLGVIAYFVMRPSASGNPPNPVPTAAAATPAASVSTASTVLDTPGLAGTWRNPTPKQSADSLDALRIGGAAPNYTAEATASCAQGECSWGMQSLTFDGQKAVGTWSPRSAPEDAKRERSVAITLQRDGPYLNVRVENTFQKGKKLKADYNFRFVRSQ